MKKMIKAAAVNAPWNIERGTASDANVKAGLVPFGKSKDVLLPNGSKLHLSSAKVTFDVNTGNISVYCNVYIRGTDDTIVAEYNALTPEELKEVYEMYCEEA